MKTNFLKRQKKVILSTIIGFFILVVLIYCLIHFLMGKILVEKNNLEKERLELEYLIKEGSKLDKYQSLSEKINENQAAIEDAIIEKEEQIKLIKSLERVASDLNVYIRKQSYTPPKKKKRDTATIPETTMSNNASQTDQQSSLQQEKSLKESYLIVNYIGSYENLLKFIYKVENLEHTVKIHSLKASVLDSLNFKRLENDLSQFQELLVGSELEADILLSFNPL